MNRAFLVFSLPLAAVASSLATAASPDAMAERLRNDPRVEAHIPYGQRIPPHVRNDDRVQFGKALRFNLSGSREFGSVGMVSPLLKPVKRGDRIVIAFWARAEKTEDGAPGRIGRVQLEATPQIRTIFEQSFDVTGEWKLYQFSGTADADYEPRALNAALHLDVAKQVLDIGPVFVFDYGQGAAAG